MRMGFAAVVCSAVIEFWFSPPLVLAQSKTVKTCQAEWRANRAVFQPKGITEQEYVDECRDFRASPAGPVAPKFAPKEAAPAAAPAAESAPRHVTHTAAPAPKFVARHARNVAAPVSVPVAKPTQTSTPKTATPWAISTP
jgi:hypothetical protein